MKKRIISIVLIAVSLILLVLPLASCDNGSVTHYATIDIEGYGKIKLELYGKEAPITVNNFVNLAESGFYEGLIFHRIIYGFMMQGGGLYPNGMEKDSPTIKGEFESNGVKNSILHERGVISMARAEDMDSASSQFFIMHKDAPHLDGDYAAFGRVIEGIEIVDAICINTPVYEYSNGTVVPGYYPIIKSIAIEKA